jgi:hypothetical protein
MGIFTEMLGGGIWLILVPLAIVIICAFGIIWILVIPVIVFLLKFLLALIVGGGPKQLKKDWEQWKIDHKDD